MKKKTFTFLMMILFICVFLISALIAISLTGSAPQRLLRVRWDETVGQTYNDLPYENAHGHAYDLYIPAGLNPNEPQHLILFIHGGSFNSGSKEDGAAWCRYYASKGYIAATLDYTLQNQGVDADLHLMNSEVANCVSAIYEECLRQGYTITGMATTGVSAGGTLAMNYAYSFSEQSAIPVRFVFQLAGPTYFEPADWGLLMKVNGIRTEAEFVSVMTGHDATDEMMFSGEYLSLIEPISPSMLVDTNSVPSLVGYGLRDHVIPAKQRSLLKEALEEHSVPHDYMEFPRSNHGMYADLDLLEEFLNISLEYCERYFVD